MLRPHSFLLLSRIAVVLTSVLLFSPPPLVHAGCGCEKPPPPLAAVRPHVTYAGKEVRLFAPTFQSGQSYNVTFVSGTGKETATVQATAVVRRDVADSHYKVQLPVQVPNLPLGPSGIRVTPVGQSTVTLSIEDAAFTVAPQPITIPARTGASRLSGFRAAVSRAGVLYFSLNLSQVTLPLVFQTQAQGYPLRFTNHNVLFYNTQGFLMQLLNEDMLGLFSIASATSSGDSDVLRYSRHEFNSFYLQHGERQQHQLDATDANWHTDGTPHIDHDYLIVAIYGHVNGSRPTPGATPAVEMVVQTFSLFQRGLVADASIEITGSVRTDSYHSQTGAVGGQNGDLWSNGKIKLADKVAVHGHATGREFDISKEATITGGTTTTTGPVTLMPVSMPSGLPDLGEIEVENTETRTLEPGSYLVSDLTVGSNGTLVIDNTNGPVTLYVTGDVDISTNNGVVTTDPDPEKFALYVIGDGAVKIQNQGHFHGVIYAPASLLDLSGAGHFFGAFVGEKVKVSNTVTLHYDTALRGE